MESFFVEKDTSLKIGSYPMVERVDFEEINNATFSTSSIHTIALITKGEILFTTLDQQKVTVRKGEMVFVPIGTTSRLEIITPSTVVVIRLSALPDWNLYCPVPEKERQKQNRFVDKVNRMQKRHPKTVKIKPKLTAYVESLNSCLTVGKGNARLMELKVKELLILIKLTYSEQEVRRLFSAVAGRELSFVEYVEQHWNEHATLKEFADAMHLTMRQFTFRFRALFNKTPYQWIIDKRCWCIYRDIVYTRKSLRQISIDQRFKSVPHFNSFCKAHMGKTPGEIRRGRLAKKENTSDDKAENKNSLCANV